MPSERVQRRIDALLDEADAALTARDWRGVAEISRAVLTMDTDNEVKATGYYVADFSRAQSCPCQRRDINTFMEGWVCTE